MRCWRGVTDKLSLPLVWTTKKAQSRTQLNFSFYFPIKTLLLPFKYYFCHEETNLWLEYTHKFIVPLTHSRIITTSLATIPTLPSQGMQETPKRTNYNYLSTLSINKWSRMGSQTLTIQQEKKKKTHYGREAGHSTLQKEHKRLLAISWDSGWIWGRKLDCRGGLGAPSAL
jgi:hypothetical protein